VLLGFQANSNAVRNKLRRQISQSGSCFFQLLLNPHNDKHFIHTLLRRNYVGEIEKCERRYAFLLLNAKGGNAPPA
jgi:hypothetical protein